MRKKKPHERLFEQSGCEKRVNKLISRTRNCAQFPLLAVLWNAKCQGKLPRVLDILEAGYATLLTGLPKGRRLGAELADLFRRVCEINPGIPPVPIE